MRYTFKNYNSKDFSFNDTLPMFHFYITFLIFITVSATKAQDPQFSQYYNAPLFLNPALTGATDCYRVGLNARTQWVGLNGSFNTGMVFGDFNYEDLRSGFGLMVLYDNIGTSKLSSTEVSGFYSYEVPVKPQFNFRMGLQGTYASRSINYSRLLFEDQYTGIAVSKDFTSDPAANFTRKQYADLSSGILFYGEDTYWLGFSAHHMNRPDQSFYLAPSRLPIQFSLHGGYSFLLGKKKIRDNDPEGMRIIPTFMYKAQTKFDQTEAGVYCIKDALLVGIWYRGIFIKQDEKIVNSDAVILQAGVRFKGFSFTYSFDYTTSKLQFRNTAGSHEISVIYLFCADWPRSRKPPRRARKLPCPDFKRSLR